MQWAWALLNEVTELDAVAIATKGVGGHVTPGRTSYLEVPTALSSHASQFRVGPHLRKEGEAWLSHVLCVSVPSLGDASYTNSVLGLGLGNTCDSVGVIFLQAQHKDFRHLCVHPLLSHQAFIEDLQHVRRHSSVG